MPRHAYIVSIDTETGEAVVAEISRTQANRVTVAPDDLRACENYGRGRHADAAHDALASIMPDPEPVQVTR